MWTWLNERDYKIVRIDDSHALLFITGNHRLFEIDASLGARMTSDFMNLTAEELRELEWLDSAGYLSDRNADVLSRGRYSDGANLAININLTGSCNLACTYCFADGGDYGRIKNKMNSDTVAFIFDFIREHVTNSQVVRLEFFGGEPLLNFTRIQEICERAVEFQTETGVSFIHRISTNLTVLPPDAVRLFSERRFIVSVSIDGGSQTHNRNRPTKNGSGSFEGVLSNCLRVRAASDAITLIARMTVVGESATLLEDVEELWAHNIFDYFQIYPGIAPSSGSTFSGGCGSLVQIGVKAEDHSIGRNHRFLRELERLLDNYPSLFTPGNRFRGVLEYERLAEMVLSGKMALAFCSAGETYFTFSPDDSIMPCHRLVGHEEFKAGTGATGLNSFDRSDWTLAVDRHPVCSQCWARYLCGGGCRQENFVASGSLRGLNEESCQYQKRLAEGVLRTVVQGGQRYRSQPRHLDDLFISCGRPVVSNGRDLSESSLPEHLEHFRLLIDHVPEEVDLCKQS